jgi:serine/threonine-protein kinase
LIGQQLSHFEITDKLGEGGMGAVYRARDSKLGREVALKVLPEDFTADAERLARFEREAQVLAALNHPNVAGIHEIGHAQSDDGSGIHFLVMELAEGEDLSAHLARGPISLEAALPIALQIAQGLEVAHDRGIVHRDLKPANIMVGSDRSVKVLDFGLAKAYMQKESSGQSSLSMSPTLTAQMTQAGTLLGTAAYMSPEQARGEEADRRADIWAFGAVLMEMLTGQKVFPGKTISDSLAGILAREPEWEALPSDLPVPIRRLLERCLEKEAPLRLQAIGEARIAIERYLADPQAASEGPSSHTEPAQTGRNWPALVAASLLTGLAAAAAMWFLEPGPPPSLVTKFELPLDVRPVEFSVSPDGRTVAYRAGEGILLRRLDALEPLEIPGTESADTFFWSPDGRWLGFQQSEQLWKVPATGGAPQVIGAVPPGGFDETVGGVGWSTDGNLYLTNGVSHGLYRMPARGGEATEILPPAETDGDFHEVTALPDGRGALFAVHRNSEGAPIDTLAVWDGQQRKDILTIPETTLSNPSYARTGHLIFQRDQMVGDRFTRGIWAAEFSLDDLEMTGELFLVASEGISPMLSEDGTLIYREQTDFSWQTTQMVWVDRTGQELATLGEPNVHVGHPAISPDDSRVLVSIGAESPDVWIHDLGRETRTRLTFEGGSQPSWSRDGQTIYYNRRDEGASFIYAKNADGSSEERQVTPGFWQSETFDGSALLFNKGSTSSNDGLFRLILDDPSEDPQHLMADLFGPSPSPDGRYLSYMSFVEPEGTLRGPSSFNIPK